MSSLCQVAGAFLKISNVISALAGVALGALLSRWNDHRRWVLDNRKLEYRELIDGIFRSTEKIRGARQTVSDPITTAVTDAVFDGSRLIRNRLFTASSIRRAGIASDWEDISRVALWEPGEPIASVDGQEYKYTQTAIAILRKRIEHKLTHLARADLGIL
jgi:hypothetical protein